MLEFAELFITDGTQYVDLLNHFHLASWRPVAIPYKDGGIMQSSPLGDCSRLVLRHYDNQAETFTLTLKAGHQKGGISDLRRLRAILELAADYQVGWSTTIVYIAARSIGENNLRYAIIVKGIVPEDPDPFSPPFNRDADGGSIGQVELQLEHWPWLGNIPTTSDALDIANWEAPPGTSNTVGVVNSTSVVTPTNSLLPIVASKANRTNLTHIYYDNGVGGFSLNQADQNPFTTTPWFRAAPAVGESTYFGVDSTQAAARGPFCSLVFDIGTAIAGFTAATWEYWNGASWVAIPSLFDGTTGFTRTGVRVVNWPQPSDWAETTVNTLLGFWVRVRITATPGPITRPTQQNRNVFTVTWPWVDIDDVEVEGDLPALLGIRVFERTGLSIQSIIVGLRSYDRGAFFSSYLNYTDSQQIPSALYFTDPDGLGVTIINDITAPTGRCAQFNAVSYTSGYLSIRLQQAFALQFRGSFRAYVRIDQTLSTPGNILLQLGVGFLNDQKRVGEWVAPQSLDAWQLVDLGKVDILTEVNQGETLGEDYELKLNISAIGTAPSVASIRLYDLILIPTDEWYAQLDASYVSGRLASNATSLAMLDANSIVNPKVEMRADRNSASNFATGAALGIQATWIPITNHYPVLQAGKQQRLWFVAIEQAIGATVLHSYPWTACSIQVFDVPRYNSMRGTE